MTLLQQDGKHLLSHTAGNSQESSGTTESGKQEIKLEISLSLTFVEIHLGECLLFHLTLNEWFKINPFIIKMSWKLQHVTSEQQNR